MRQHKTLPWVDGPEGTQTSDYWGVHPRPDQLSYPSGFKKEYHIPKQLFLI